MTGWHAVLGCAADGSRRWLCLAALFAPGYLIEAEAWALIDE